MKIKCIYLNFYTLSLLITVRNMFLDEMCFVFVFQRMRRVLQVFIFVPFRISSYIDTTNT